MFEALKRWRRRAALELHGATKALTAPNATWRRVEVCGAPEERDRILEALQLVEQSAPRLAARLEANVRDICVGTTQSKYVELLDSILFSNLEPAHPIGDGAVLVCEGTRAALLRRRRRLSGEGRERLCLRAALLFVDRASSILPPVAAEHCRELHRDWAETALASRYWLDRTWLWPRRPRR